MAAKKPTKSVGRPSKYDPAYCATVIELGREGASKAEMTHALGVSRPTMDGWAAQHPEFLYSVKEAIDLAQGWWEQKGREATFGGSPGFNATAFIFQMKNRFPNDWRDRQEHRHSGPNGGPIPTVDLTNASNDDLDRLESLFGPLAGTAGDDAEADTGGEGTAEG